MPSRVMEWPGTRAGRWAFYLLGSFVVLLSLFFGMIALYGGGDEVRRLSVQAGGRFFSLPLFGVTLTAAFVSVLAAAGAALGAFCKGDRSILLLLPAALGGLALLFAIGEFFEGMGN
jgi:hypothetical protein